MAGQRYGSGMNIKFAGVAFLVLAGGLGAQAVTVSAAGDFYFGWQGPGPFQVVSQAVTGPITFAQPTVGSISLTTGSVTTLTVRADSPPWPGPVQGWWSQAVAILDVTYTSDVPVAGILRLSLTPACMMGMAPFLDVEADGLYEIAPTGLPTTVDVPVVLGPRGVVIHIEDTTVNFGAACLSTASIEFLPQPTNLSTTGVACGPNFSASLLPPATSEGRMTLHLEGDSQSVIAAIVLGGTPLPMGLVCGQGLVDDALVLLTPVAAGFDVPVPLSTGLVGSIELQYVGAQSPVQLAWSNRLTLTLP